MTYPTDKQRAIDTALGRLPAVERKFLGRKEIKELPAILWEDEEVERLITGTYQRGTGILVLTDRRLIFIDKGMIAGLKVEDFGIDRISSVESSTGLVMGSLTIYASGNKEEFSNVPKDALTGFATHLRARLGGAATAPVPPQTPAPSLASAPAPVSLADELGKLAALRDAGVLSEDEFETQKQRLLA